MNFDLELILVYGTAITGAIWLLEILWLGNWRRKRAMEKFLPENSQKLSAREAKKGYREPWYVEYSKSFFPVFFIVLILRSFIAEPFRIPSSSMLPTLIIGDFIVVNKFSYGIRLPVVHTKVIEIGQPKRGDVVVFRYPRDPSIDYIKRVVGVPGDVIRYSRKQLWVNNKPVRLVDEGVYAPGSGNIHAGPARRYKEYLPDHEHEILLTNMRTGNEGWFKVPEGQYLVFGDNRDNSNDSRVWGTVPEENLVGKASFIWMNWDFNQNRVEFSRIGTKIQ